MSTHRRPRATIQPLAILLTTGAVLGVVCLVAATTCVVLGLRPMVVTSGSMSPSIPAGSLVLAEDVPAAEAEVGDVVAVPRADGSRVMHRVVTVTASGEQVALTLQGDANAAPDPETYVVDRVLAVRLDVPWLGYPVAWLSTPGGLLGLGAAACGLVLFAFRRTSAPSAAATPGSRRRAAARLAVPLAAVVVATMATPAWAGFTDTGTVTSGSVATHAVVAPASSSCSAVLLAATVSWPGDQRYDYEVVLRQVSNGTVVSTRQVTGASTSTTYSGLASFGLVAGAGTFDFQVELRSYLADTTTWRSATVRTYQNIRVAAVVVGATVSCTT